MLSSTCSPDGPPDRAKLEQQCERTLVLHFDRPFHLSVLLVTSSMKKIVQVTVHADTKDPGNVFRVFRPRLQFVRDDLGVEYDLKLLNNSSLEIVSSVLERSAEKVYDLQGSFCC